MCSSNMDLIYIIVSASLFISASAQNQPDSASSALNQFALNFLAETCSQANNRLNIALSPYTVWSVMAMINEGARGNTEIQLEAGLGIPPPNTTTRERFQQVQQRVTQSIMRHTDGVSLEVLNAIFTTLGKRLLPNYQQLVGKVYGADVTPLNFNDRPAATRYINNKLSAATKGRINSIVKEDDLADAEIFITSALFFKGLWESKFNKTTTRTEDFYNERKQVTGTVQMMYNQGFYPYANILNDKAAVVELPYKGKQMSMYVVLPKPTNSLQTILNMLAQRSFSTVLDALRLSTEIFSEDQVKVYLPKFKILSDLNLNYVLHKMGMQDIFQADVCDLSGISPDDMFLSRVIHQAEIQVDEDGTVASAVTSGITENKIPPISFLVNKPFAFFIYDKETQSLIFTGRYSSPN